MTTNQRKVKIFALLGAIASAVSLGLTGQYVEAAGLIAAALSSTSAFSSAK